MATLRLFGPARDAAGNSRVTLSGERVRDVLAAAEAQFGEEFSRIISISNIWLNGESADPDAPVNDGDEVAVLPPVSGG